METEVICYCLSCVTQRADHTNHLRADIYNDFCMYCRRELSIKKSTMTDIREKLKKHCWIDSNEDHQMPLDEVVAILESLLKEIEGARKEYIPYIDSKMPTNEEVDSYNAGLDRASEIIRGDNITS